MFKKTHQLDTLYADRAYLEEFMDAYEISYTTEQLIGKMRFTAEMTKREFSALCDYIVDLRSMGVDLIRL